MKNKIKLILTVFVSMLFVGNVDAASFSISVGSRTLNPGGSKTLSAGYYSGGTIKCNSATSAIKTTTLNIAGSWNNNTASGSVSGTIVGIKSMTRNGNSNPPLSISTSGGTLTVEWNSYNGTLNLSFTVAYI